ncbi:methylmalonyl-CoA mutase [Nocardioides sp. zg-579]|uniref:Methylmalonyl-CoA mutase n=1 Tax=Nocardioides marmotae TaxID=2663857 RepID=A0A6I3IX46_9ACTN|nr:methylmalonyl-CoA mutase family protein [Nocardioides marmotae]MCR6031314.1 methylmalonyl-CoA mutase [Gordonia jinghuaiqii]MTB94953.1 methylmalonyl-CoA mutase [Nocardioides marmotae]QKE02536.1 methylmalonyl-CoA mutase [Nocardioides marmotae]
MTQPQGAVEGGLDEPAGLEPEQGTLDLAGDGDRWTVQDWEQAAAAVLRKSRRLQDDDPDAAVWSRLTRTTLDGIEVTPLGTPALLEGLQTQGRPTRVGPWDVRAHLGGTGVPAKQANEEALVDLDGGVVSLWVTADAATDLPALLAGVLLDLAPVVLDAPTAPVAVAEAFLAHLGATTPAEGTNLGADGRASEEDLVAVARLAREKGVLGVVVDATVAHDLGASDAQELGYSMWVGARVLRVLSAAGIDVAEAARLVEFRYAATDEQFPTIAKLRAARRLWARVLELSEVPADVLPAQRQHVVTSRPMMSKYDPYVNMLRTTVAAFSAGVGGADAVTVLPFDSPLGRPDLFGRRIARNTSHLLVDEAHVAKVADPAGGSYAVEKLTDDLAVAGWDVLGRLEEGASLDDAIAETVARREREIATRKRPITGLTEFPHLAEQLPERAPDPAAAAVRRYGAAFEELRDAPAARPVFLATLGPVAAHTARATFATNLLAAGGIAVEVAGPTGSVADVLAAYDASTTPVVCLAGADATYDEWADQLVPALREAGARHVIVAGKPRDGVDDSCAMGVDALAFLTRTREQLQ